MYVVGSYLSLNNKRRKIIFLFYTDSKMTLLLVQVGPEIKGNSLYTALLISNRLGNKKFNL